MTNQFDENPAADLRDYIIAAACACLVILFSLWLVYVFAPGSRPAFDEVLPVINIERCDCPECVLDMNECPQINDCVAENASLVACMDERAKITSGQPDANQESIDEYIANLFADLEGGKEQLIILENMIQHYFSTTSSKRDALFSPGDTWKKTVETSTNSLLFWDASEIHSMQRYFPPGAHHCNRYIEAHMYALRFAVDMDEIAWRLEMAVIYGSPTPTFMDKERLFSLIDSARFNVDKALELLQ